MGKINLASDLVGALAAYDENKTEVFELTNIFQVLTARQDGLALHTREKC